MSNQDWKSPDGDARIAKMKDGRTHLAHNAEHVVGVDSGALAVTLQGADQGDTTTLDETLSEAGIAVAEQMGREAELRPDDKPKVNVDGIDELIGRGQGLSQRRVGLASQVLPGAQQYSGRAVKRTKCRRPSENVEI